MGIDFNQTFGRSVTTAGNRNAKSQDDRPKAQYWLNIGYTIVITTEDGNKEDRFISLPMGIPLDTMELLKTNSQNEFFAGFQAARNDLWQQMMDLCKVLEPGQESIIAVSESGLSVQLRRVNAEQPAIKAEANPFAKKLAFA